MTESRLPVIEFLDFLRRGEVPEGYLRVYQSEAEMFIGCFPKVALDQLSLTEIERYLDYRQRCGATLAQLRNVTVVCEAVLTFLTNLRARAGAPAVPKVQVPSGLQPPVPTPPAPSPVPSPSLSVPPAASPPRPPAPAAPRPPATTLPMPSAPTVPVPSTPITPNKASGSQRQFRRIPFITEVEVVGIGTLRSADLSLGGMYLEMMGFIPGDTVLQLRFRLRDGDANHVTAEARVVYVHEGVGVGLAFIELSETDRRRIKRLIDGH